MMTLLERIQTREAKVVVVGAGYVGLPLAVEVAKAGFQTTAYDKSVEKVQALGRGVSYIKDVPSESLAPLIKAGKLDASADPEVLSSADVIIICVPTPLNKTKDPDNSFIVDAAAAIAPRLHAEQLIILESTTFPGFTREVLLPQLEKTGLKVGKDFFLAFSPERVDPGNAKFHTKNTPKVIGGTTPACLEIAQAMYSEVLDRIIPVSSTDAAEMVKLLENTYRAVNIGLVNEVAIMCGKLGLDTWEVIDAAATKPFGFMPFYPGPGLGGHCIPVDPHYLSWKLKTLKYNARFIELAGEINSNMPEVVVQRVADALNHRRIPINGARILLLGVSYKRDIDDVRESPSLDILALLQERGAHVSFHDPHVERLLTHDGKAMMSVPLTRLSDYECVIIVTDHTGVDYARVVAESQLVVDTRNATKNMRRDFPGRVVPL
jgi:UDP-N-acetyl-D-glucosamine dehydrogenase